MAGTEKGFIYVYSNTGLISGGVPSSDMENKGIIQFQFNPAELTISREVEWSTESMIGASHPRYFFANGGKRILKFTLELYKPGYNEKAIDDKRFKDGYRSFVYEQIRFLESLTYPSYSGGVLISSPPIVGVVLGKMFDNFAVSTRNSSFVASTNSLKSSAFLGVITSMEIKAYYLFDPRTMFPQRADVSITVEEVDTSFAKNRSTEDVSTGGR